jgi:hypothetical protein
MESGYCIIVLILVIGLIILPNNSQNPKINANFQEFTHCLTNSQFPRHQIQQERNPKRNIKIFQK